MNGGKDGYIYSISLMNGKLDENAKMDIKLFKKF